MNGGDLPDPLERLAHSLTEAAEFLHQSHDAEADRLLGLVGGLLEAVRTVAGTYQRHADGSLPEVGLSNWLRALRESVTAITGWAQMLVVMRDETRRVQARDAMERNAARLRQLLDHPPV